MGRRKFFTMAGPERVKYMTQMYKDLSPDMIKYIQEGQGVDLLGNVPPRLIESIKKAWNFKKKNTRRSRRIRINRTRNRPSYGVLN